MILCGVSMSVADDYKEADMTRTIIRLKASADQSVSQYAFGAADADSGFRTYIPKDAEVTKERDFDFDDDSKFSRAYTVESKKDAFRLEIYIHKISELTLLPWWASEWLVARGYTVGPANNFVRGSKPSAGEFFINCGAATEPVSPARMVGAQEAVTVAARNGNAIILAVIEYGGSNLERNRDLASRFYSNFEFAQESDKSFAIDETLTFKPTGTKIAVRASKDWQHKRTEDADDTSVLLNIRSTNGEANAIVETRIFAQDSEQQDYAEKAKEYLAAFLYYFPFFDEDKGFKFAVNPIPKSFKTKHQMFSYLFAMTTKTGVPYILQISYLKGSKEDVAVLSSSPANSDLDDRFLAFKARASAERLVLDAVKLADESMN